jgi:hypothetical protein
MVIVVKFAGLKAIFGAADMLAGTQETSGANIGSGDTIPQSSQGHTLADPPF